MSENALIPADRQNITFYDDEILALRLPNGEIHIPLRPICDAIGLNWAGQRQRIQRDPVLSQIASIIQVSREGTRGGNPNMLCLPLDYINGWLFGISADRVRPELRDRVIRYQTDCYKTLAEAFKEGRIAFDSSFDNLLEGDSPAVQAFKMAQAIMHMAKQQILLEARLEGHDERLGASEKRIGTLENRLESVEITLGNPDRLITPEQASQISEAVKAVAHEFGKQTGRNEYGGVYAELYRRFSVNSYKMLPAKKFAEAMNWLNHWLQELQDANSAF